MEPLTDENIRTYIDRYFTEGPINNISISDWDVSAVTNMRQLFKNRKTFNENINNWNVANVTTMNQMFYGCIEFNQPLNNWNVSNVTSMNEMFSGCTIFNQPLDNWNVSKVRNMYKMFYNCTNFNQPLNNWDVSKVNNMTDMFYNCRNFNQPLTSWNLTSINIGFGSIFKNTSMIEDNKPSLLFTNRIYDENVDYYKYLKPDKNDAVYNQFNEMMETFDNKPQTIPNEAVGFTKDSILYDEQNPYLIHYEKFNGKSYPIITILKGTVLFTGRRVYEPNPAKSMFHLYKFNRHKTLESYKDNIATTLTFFYPVPFMSSVVDRNFIMMDMVTLTENVKLLCCIGPSPIITELDEIYGSYETQLFQDDFEDDMDDLDFTPPYSISSTKVMKDIIHGLKLNGVIGVCEVDSVNCPNQTDAINDIKDKIEFDNSLLVRSSCFKNLIHKDKSMPKLDYNFIESIFMYRTWGIPEIVLIPFNYHKNNNPMRYKEIYDSFLEFDAKNINLKTTEIIFKIIKNIHGRDAYELGTNMEKHIINYSRKFGKSVQAYPLLTTYKDYFDPAFNIPTNRPLNINDVSFVKSYEEENKKKRHSNKSMCAFEIGEFYKQLEKLHETTTVGGGSLDTVMTNNIPNLYKSATPIKTINSSQKIEEPIGLIKNRVNTENVFYSEVANIPIFFVKKIREHKREGGNKKRKIIRKRKTVRKRISRKGYNGRGRKTKTKKRVNRKR